MAAHGNHWVACINNKVELMDASVLGRACGCTEGQGVGGMNTCDGLHQVDGAVLGGVLLHLEFF